MGKCFTCGNDYDDSFDIHMSGDVFTFDCFECAISKLAPECENCGQKIIGHGVQAGTSMYCCAHCAREKDESGIQDRAEVDLIV